MTFVCTVGTSTITAGADWLQPAGRSRHGVPSQFARHCVLRAHHCRELHANSFSQVASCSRPGTGGGRGRQRTSRGANRAVPGRAGGASARVGAAAEHRLEASPSESDLAATATSTHTPGSPGVGGAPSAAGTLGSLHLADPIISRRYARPRR